MPGEAPTAERVGSRARPFRRSSALVEVLAVVVAAAGPLSASATGSGIAPLAVVAVALVSSLAIGGLGGRRWARAAVLAVAVASLVALGSTFSAAWLATGLLVGDWQLRGRPPLPNWPTPAPDAALAGAAPYLVAVVTGPYRSVQVALAVVVGLVALAGFDRALTSQVPQVAAIVAAGAVGGLVAAPADPDRSTAAAAAVGLLAAHLVAVASAGGARWSLRRRLGVLAGAVPAALWWAAATAIWVTGAQITGRVGYGAFTRQRADLPASATGILAVTAVPAAMLALLAVGVGLELDARGTARRVLVGSTVVTAAALVAGAGWWIGP